jgi:hypothetical protein
VLADETYIDGQATNGLRVSLCRGTQQLRQPRIGRPSGSPARSAKPTLDPRSLPQPPEHLLSAPRCPEPGQQAEGFSGLLRLLKSPKLHLVDSRRHHSRPIRFRGLCRDTCHFCLPQRLGRLGRPLRHLPEPRGLRLGCSGRLLCLCPGLIHRLAELEGLLLGRRLGGAICRDLLAKLLALRRRVGLGFRPGAPLCRDLGLCRTRNSALISSARASARSARPCSLSKSVRTAASASRSVAMAASSGFTTMDMSADMTAGVSADLSRFPRCGVTPDDGTYTRTIC